MTAIGIFGTSGMAREAGDIAWALGLEPMYVTNDAANLSAWPFPGVVILETDLALHPDLPCVIGIADGALRERIAQRYPERHFANLIHPQASLGRGQREVIEDAQGVLICAGARLTSNIQIGEFVIINQNACVAHDTVIDPYVHVAPGACVSGHVHLSRRCWIGAGAVVNQGSEVQKRLIGADVVVGSGAVVTADCEPGGTYAGVPARRIK